MAEPARLSFDRGTLVLRGRDEANPPGGFRDDVWQWNDHHYQTAFVPDFVFTHEDGTEALLEIVGFWTPECLDHKREVVRKFRKRHRILLAVREQSLREGVDTPDDVIVYRTALTLKPVLTALEGYRGRASTDM